MNRSICKWLVPVVALLVTAALVPGTIQAKGPQDVSIGKHNFSVYTNAPTFMSNEEEVCVFCHTPHGGTLSAPLWNRTNPTNTAGYWTHYTSRTLGSAAQTWGTTRSLGDESLVCMSCHDGSIAVNHVINPPNSREGAPILIGGQDSYIVNLAWFPGGARIGSGADPDDTGDLSDDHPISFSYAAVIVADPYTPAGARDGQLRTVNEAQLRGVRFFGGAAARVECSSCHDPHVDYITNEEYTPFLITPNTGSNLCLACHNK